MIFMKNDVFSQDSQNDGNNIPSTNNLNVGGENNFNNVTVNNLNTENNAPVMDSNVIGTASNVNTSVVDNNLNIREQQEQKEFDELSPYAAKSAMSKGRAKEEEKCPLRTEFQRDRDRIIHSKAFRRLKHKTNHRLRPYPVPNRRCKHLPYPGYLWSYYRLFPLSAALPNIAHACHMRRRPRELPADRTDKGYCCG